MKNIIINKSSLLILSLSLFVLVSCGKKEAVEEHEEEKSETEVALTEAQFKTIGIETGTIVKAKSCHIREGLGSVLTHFLVLGLELLEEGSDKAGDAGL